MTRSKPSVMLWVAAVLMLALFASFSVSAHAGETTLNQVSDWCNGDDGTKYEPVDTPFIVPAPPSGTFWTLIVLKGGTTNETFANPSEGDSFSHTQHGNSHVILCWEELSDTTTTSSTTSSTTSTSTTSTSTTTTVDTTTTTEPETSTTTTSTSSTTTTTSATTTTTLPSQSTTTSVPDTSSTAPPSTTTQPPSTTTTQPPELPNTGADDVVPLALAGAALVLLGSLSLAALRATGSGHDDQ